MSLIGKIRDFFAEVFKDPQQVQIENAVAKQKAAYNEYRWSGGTLDWFTWLEEVYEDEFCTCDDWEPCGCGNPYHCMFCCLPLTPEQLKKAEEEIVMKGGSCRNSLQS